MSGRLVLALSLLVAGCAAPPLETAVLHFPYPAGGTLDNEDYRALAKAVSGAYVAVRIRDPAVAGERGDRGRSDVVNGASGTVIDDAGYVVTAAHIALSEELVAEVTTLGGVIRPARIVDVTPERELALLKIEPLPGLRAAPFASRRPLAGAPVLAIGTPGNRRGAVSVGEVRVPRRPQRIAYGRYGYDEAIGLRMEVEPGHSGGPVFGAGGELIGMIASFGLGDTRRVPYVSTRTAYAVPAHAIAAYFNATRRHRRP